MIELFGIKLLTVPSAPLNTLTIPKAINNGIFTPSSDPASLPITMGDTFFYQNRLCSALKSYFTPEEAKDGILVSFGDSVFEIVEADPEKNIQKISET